MNIPRGYNASTLLADGSVLTLGGSWSGGVGGKHGEIWTARRRLAAPARRAGRRRSCTDARQSGVAATRTCG